MNHEEYERMYRFEDTYWWFTARRGLITTLLSDLYPRTGQLNILDIGCGTGAMLDELAPFGSVVGADFSPEALRFCRSRGSSYPLTRADVRRLPFADNTFDIVTAMDIVEHIDDDKAACAEVRRVLKPGGRLFATVPAFPSLWSEHDEALHHFRRYTVPHLRDVLGRVGFLRPRLSYTVTALFPPIYLYRQIGRLLPHPAGHEKKANLVNFSAPVNTLLRRLSDWETQFVRTRSLPFGVSVVCVAQKPTDAAAPPIRKTLTDVARARVSA